MFNSVTASETPDSLLPSCKIRIRKIRLLNPAGTGVLCKSPRGSPAAWTHSSLLSIGSCLLLQDFSALAQGQYFGQLRSQAVPDQSVRHSHPILARAASSNGYGPVSFRIEFGSSMCHVLCITALKESGWLRFD
jgi:hypothetical protein